MNYITFGINTHLQSLSHTMRKMNTLTVPRFHDRFFPSFPAFVVPVPPPHSWLATNNSQSGSDRGCGLAIPKQWCYALGAIFEWSSPDVVEHYLAGTANRLENWWLNSADAALKFRNICGHRRFRPRIQVLFFLWSWFHPKLSLGEKTLEPVFLASVLRPQFNFSSVELEDRLVWKYCGVQIILQMWLTPLNRFCYIGVVNRGTYLGTSLIYPRSFSISLMALVVTTGVPLSMASLWILEAD